MALQTHFQLRDAQLNMDVIEKRVSGNERVHNWWAVGPEWPSCRCPATRGCGRDAPPAGRHATRHPGPH